MVRTDGHLVWTLLFYISDGVGVPYSRMVLSYSLNAAVQIFRMLLFYFLDVSGVPYFRMVLSYSLYAATKKVEQ